MSLAAAKTESSGRIPVLDIAAYLAGDAGAAAPLARALARTCEDTGFLVVANHGVPQRLVDDIFAVARQHATCTPTRRRCTADDSERRGVRR
jgi:isopenicillin N synthase-like dioxygenase